MYVARRTWYVEDIADHINRKKHWIIGFKDWLLGEQVQNEFSIVMYRSDAFSNGDDEAIDYAFSSQTTLQLLQYTEDELFMKEK
jgi:hypothetical protein